MAGPGQHAGALEVTTGSLVFQHTEKEVVNIGTKHYRHFVSVMTDAVDGEDDMTAVWDATVPRPPAEKHLSFFPEESLYGVSKGGSSSTADPAGKRMNTACGISTTGLNQGSVAGGTDPWTLAFWSYQTTQNNTAPPGRPNGHNWFMFQAHFDDVMTWSCKVQTSNDRIHLEARDNCKQNAAHNINGVDGVKGNETSDLYFVGSHDPDVGASAADKWAHYAFVCNGAKADLSSSIKLYINGTEWTSVSETNRRSADTNIKNGTYSVTNVGWQGWNTLTFFNQKSQTGATSDTGCHRHKFDEMVFWKGRALTGGEVGELYNGGSHKIMTTHSRYSDLTSYWRFDSDSVIDNTANPPFKMVDSKGNHHITSSLRFSQGGNQQSRLSMTGSSLQSSVLKGDYVSSSLGQWNSNLATYGEYHYTTGGGFTAGDLAIYTTAPFSGSVNYKVISRDHRDRGY